jgi:RHS repeat-associated protein
MGRFAHHQAVRQTRNAEAEIERIYRYDRGGNLRGRHDKQRGNTVFEYDPTGRILSAKGRIEEFFEFDPAGNRQPPGFGSFEVPGNRVTVFGDLRYAYDVHGNVTSRKKGAHEEIRFTWNAGHRLTEAKVTRKGTTQTTRYEYDALGRRTRKIDAFGVTEFLWDGDLMIESRRNNKQALFLFEPYSFVPLATVQDEKTYWYQCDQVGAPQELTDREGNIVWATDYTVWGEATLRKTGTDGSSRYARRRQAEPPPVLEQPFRFMGQQFDEETGLHYNNQRDYDPITGRYLQSDPIGLKGGVNAYAYTASNPLKYVDPLGLEVWGLNLGVSGTMLVKTSYSFQILFDSQGNFGFQRTQEVGGGLGSAAGVFVNAMFGGPESMDDLEGWGTSASGSAWVVNGAATIPISTNYQEDTCGNFKSFEAESPGRVLEGGLGLSIGTPEAGITATYTDTLWNTSILGDIGRWLGRTAYDLTH